MSTSNDVGAGRKHVTHPRLHPSAFALSRATMRDEIVPMEKRAGGMAPLIPGKTKTYIYATEAEYRHMYAHHIWAQTRKKSGWDCFRHWEIMAAGCIPVWTSTPPLSACPLDTMNVGNVKELWARARSQFDAWNRADVKARDAMTPVLTTLAQDCLEWCHTHALDYWLAQTWSDGGFQRRHPLPLSLRIHGGDGSARISFPNPRDCVGSLKADGAPLRTVLMLSAQDAESDKIDYLCETVVLAFKEAMGAAAHEWPKRPWLYESFPESSCHKLYGRGMNYTRLLNDDARDDTLDEERDIKEWIESKAFDLIVYPVGELRMPFYDTVMKWYDPEDVLFFFGEDNRDNTHLRRAKKMHALEPLLQRGHHVFVRELKPHHDVNIC
jgi:hypothetical protein